MMRLGWTLPPVPEPASNLRVLAADQADTTAADAAAQFAELRELHGWRPVADWDWDDGIEPADIPGHTFGLPS